MNIRIRQFALATAIAAMAALTAPAAAPAQSFYGQNYQDYISGRVGVAQPYNLYFGGSNGVHIRLHDFTVITPSGTTLLPGMQLQVWGHWNNDGTFDATQIQVVDTGGVNSTYVPPAYAPSPYSTTYSRPYMTPYGSNYDTSGGYLSGSVSSFSPYNMWMNGPNGALHVTLHDGTVINPTGITLTAGMRVHVWGYTNANGTFEANQIDVLNPDRFGY